MKHCQWLVGLTGLVAVVGCGSDDAGSGQVEEWLGESTHLAISGTYQGMEFDVDLEGEAAAGVHCERFYAPLVGTEPDASGNYDTSQLYFAMTEIGAKIDVSGMTKEFNISYWRHDVAAGTDLDVTPRVFGTSIPEGKTWSDINVFDPGADVLSGIESAAESGTVAMKLNTGDPDQNGIMKASGSRTGAYYSVSWGPDDFLKVSATANCSPGIVVTWPQNFLVP